MKRTRISLGLLLLLPITHSAIAGDEPIDRKPVVLSSIQGAPFRKMIMPSGIVAIREGIALASMQRTQGPSITEVWLRVADGSWKKQLVIDALTFPKVFAIDGDLGLIGAGGNGVEGYGMDMMFYRIAAGQVQGKKSIAAPRRRGFEAGGPDRLTVSSVHVAGKTISVFLLLERRKEGNQLLFTRSTDGGQNWPAEPTLMADTTMHEDYSRLGSYQFSALELARFVIERGRPLALQRTVDGGKTWQQQTVVLSDDLPKNVRRLPLASWQFSDNTIAAVYLAADPARAGKGRHYFSRSKDKGQTWASGVPISDWHVLEDPSMFFSISGVGDALAACFMETTGNWSKGEVRSRLLVSRDRGNMWTERSLAKHFQGNAIMSVVGLHPKGDRLYLASSVFDAQASQNSLAVLELSLAD